MNEQNIQALIEDRISQLPAELVKMVTGGELRSFCNEIAQEESFTDEQRILFTNECVLVLLMFESIADLEKNLSSYSNFINIDTEFIALEFAEIIYSQVLHHFENNVTDIEKHDAVQPLRTMEGDAQRIHGYGAYRVANPVAGDEEPIHVSNQEESLSATKPLAERPTYTPTPEPAVVPTDTIPERVSGFAPKE